MTNLEQMEAELEALLKTSHDALIPTLVEQEMFKTAVNLAVETAKVGVAHIPGIMKIPHMVASTLPAALTAELSKLPHELLVKIMVGEQVAKVANTAVMMLEMSIQK